MYSSEVINSNFLRDSAHVGTNFGLPCTHTSAEAYRRRGMINRSLHLSFGSYDSAPWCTGIPRERGLDKWSGFKYTVKAPLAKSHLDVTIKFTPDFLYPRETFRKIACWKRRDVGLCECASMHVRWTPIQEIEKCPETFINSQWWVLWRIWPYEYCRFLDQKYRPVRERKRKREGMICCSVCGLCEFWFSWGT